MTRLFVYTTATSSHSHIKIQFYSTPNAPTVGIDAVDVHHSITRGGGFNQGTHHWSVTGSGNLASCTSASGTLPYEGSRFDTTNGSGYSDSIYSDTPMTINTGQMVCTEALITTLGSSSGGSSVLTLWFTGGSYNEASTHSYSNLPGNNVWTPAKTCLTATTAHTAVRAQFYPTPNTPTIGVDIVDTH